MFVFYSLLTCDLSDHGEIMYSPFPVCCPRSGGTLQAPLCPPPRPVPRRCDSHQGNYKRNKSEHEGRRKEHRRSTVQRLNRSCGRHEVGGRQEQWSPPSTRLLRPRSLLVQPLPHLRLRHRAHGVLLLGRHSPSHIRGGEGVQYRPPAPFGRPGSSTGSPTSQSPSAPPPTVFSAGPSTQGAP